MRVTGNSDDGINGTTVTSLSLNNCFIENNGSASATGEGLFITGLFGSSTWTNTTFKGSGHNNAWVHNDNGTLTSLSISGVNFASNSTATGNDGLLFEAFGTSVVNAPGVLINNS